MDAEKIAFTQTPLAAAELGRRRPEIPFLVVEGRGTSDWLGRLPLDLSGAKT